MKFKTIIADNPWSFNDTLNLKGDVKRSAEANYSVMTAADLSKLPIQDLADDSAILCSWCPSSLLDQGLEVMKAWGFKFVTTVIWVKVKKDTKGLPLEECLGFGLGHSFRSTHEVCLVGVRGKGLYQQIKNKSQRSVFFAENLKHSQKPENIHRSLELMFPDTDNEKVNRLELFARRNVNGWVCVGNETPGNYFKMDIIDALNIIKDLPNTNKTLENAQESKEETHEETV